jgi:hypothetical protein
MRPIVILVFVALAGCSSPATPTCDQECQDGVTIRALREGMARIYNKTFPQPLPAGVTPPQDYVPPPVVPNGPQDLMVLCDAVHAVHVVGDAVSDEYQGITTVSLTYDVPGCLSENKNDPTPEGNYSLLITGTLFEVGKLSQGNRVTAVVIRGDGVSFSGTIFDPAIALSETCDVDLVQNGNNVSGRICGRIAGYDQ